MRAHGQTVLRFRRKVFSFYKKHGRRMPWRDTRDPYRILVSEAMLQQTQVARVLEKYPLFIRRFPTVSALARASLSEVLQTWSGLGYNRRAKFLHQTAHRVMKEYGGRVPRTEEELRTLPGVGKSTAGGILAFAFNKPAVFIETNIRRVFIHHFFPDKTRVADIDILPLVEQALDRKNPRQWYYALFDYGTHLAAIHENPNRKSAHYAKQSPFKGSSREARGKILSALTKRRYTLPDLAAATGLDQKMCKHAVDALVREGLVTRRGTSFMVG